MLGPKKRRDQITLWLINSFGEAIVSAATSDTKVEAEVVALQRDALKHLDGVDPWLLVAPIEVA